MSVSESQSPEKVCVMSRVTRLPSLEVPYLTFKSLRQLVISARVEEVDAGC
jgi:hypothetical protein